MIEALVNLLDVSAFFWRSWTAYILAVRPIVDVALHNTMPTLPITIVVEHRADWSINGKLRP